MDDGFERVWEEVVVACFKISFQYFPRRSEKYHNDYIIALQ
jgi:hypothetical protein